MTEEKIEKYVHPALNEEVCSVSGHYILMKEARLVFMGRDVLYYVGHAAFDTSCCGEGGCAYAFVVGFIKQWKIKKTKEGHDISQIVKIKNESDRIKISVMLKEDESVHQVNFN